MSNATHTPGPWHDRQVTGSMATRIYGGGRAGTKDCRMVCEIPYRPRTAEEQGEKTANANLILAAPDLLRELSHLVRLVEPLEHGGEMDVPGLATLNGARAAIAKATGASA